MYSATCFRSSKNMVAAGPSRTSSAPSVDSSGAGGTLATLCVLLGQLLQAATIWLHAVAVGLLAMQLYAPTRSSESHWTVELISLTIVEDE